MSSNPPTARQLRYLGVLADRAGQTFVRPDSAVAASREIQRLKRARPSTPAERALERFGDARAIEAAQDAVQVHGFELIGYGSECTWSQRS